MSAMIELIDICKSYPIHHGRSQKLVLDRVNLRVDPGKKWGILGRGGAGKSAMTRIISSSDLPYSVMVRREVSVSWPLAFGDAFQSSLTDRGNAKLISRIYGVDFHKTLDMVEDFAVLGPYMSEPMKSYSSGMQPRLAFAISMAIRFDCFLIAEGMSVGDHRFTKKCVVELIEKRQDRAMIIVAHQVELIHTHCDHAAVLETGKLAAYDRWTTSSRPMRRCDSAPPSHTVSLSLSGNLQPE